MPSVHGLYSLTEMRERVRRRIDAIRPESLGTDGAESANKELDLSISNEDIDFYLNYSLTAHAVDMFADAAQVLSDHIFVDILADQAEYPLPEDMSQLRGLWWKPEGVAFTLTPPNDRVYMYNVDDPVAGEFFMNGAPTYRRQLGNFVLNESPTTDNEGGVEIRYVKWFNPLVIEDQTLETEFAPMLQQVIIIDAAKQLLDARFQIDSSRMEAELTKAENRLSLAVRNSTAPLKVNIISSPGVRLPEFRRITSRWANYSVSRY